VYSYDSANTWNSPQEMTYTYGGISCTNFLGNYWSDCSVSDEDGDGICDRVKLMAVLEELFISFGREQDV